MHSLARFATTLILIACSVPARAQTAAAPDRFEDLQQRLHAGDALTVVLADGTRVGGRLVEINAATLTVEHLRDQQRETLQAPQIGRVIVEDPVKESGRRGRIIGAIAG